MWYLGQGLYLCLHSDVINKISNQYRVPRKYILALWGIGQRQKGLTLEGGMNLEFVALYWHFVDIVWIVLFTVVYLI